MRYGEIYEEEEGCRYMRKRKMTTEGGKGGVAG